MLPPISLLNLAQTSGPQVLGGGEVRRGGRVAVPGVGAGDVAHGALKLEVSLEIRAPSGCCGVDSDSLVGMACMGAGF